MSYRYRRFAISSRLYCNGTNDEAEPKRNIALVFQHDFSSKFSQLSYLANPPGGGTAMPVPEGLAFVAWFDVLVEPTRRLG